MDYRKRLADQPKKHGNQYVSAALGEKQISTLKPDEGTFNIPLVKFPSKTDEVESVKLFYRCGGPFAATVSGYEKLVRDEKPRYGDCRPLRLCRVSGCRMEHSESVSIFHLDVAPL